MRDRRRLGHLRWDSRYEPGGHESDAFAPSQAAHPTAQSACIVVERCNVLRRLVRPRAQPSSCGGEHSDRSARRSCRPRWEHLEPLPGIDGGRRVPLVLRRAPGERVRFERSSLARSCLCRGGGRCRRVAIGPEPGSDATTRSRASHRQYRRLDEPLAPPVCR